MSFLSPFDICRVLGFVMLSYRFPPNSIEWKFSIVLIFNEVHLLKINNKKLITFSKSLIRGTTNNHA